MKIEECEQWEQLHRLKPGLQTSPDIWSARLRMLVAFGKGVVTGVVIGLLCCVAAWLCGVLLGGIICFFKAGWRFLQ